jgi:adhesin transport system outer membrane protein
MTKKGNCFAILLGISYSYCCFSMTLSEAIQYSVINSPRVLQTVKVCLANEQAYKGAIGGYFPTVDVNGAAGYEYSENNGTRTSTTGSANRTLFRTEFGVEARQMLFDGMSTMHNVGRNKFKLNASAWVVAAEANEHAVRVAEAYVNVLRQREIVNSAEENVTIHKRTADMIIRRSDSGVSRNTDAVQAKGRLAQAASNLKAVQGRLQDAEIAFFRVSGIRTSNFVSPKINKGCLPSSERQVVKKSIELHPALRAANSDILEAYSQHKEAKSTMMPRVDLVGSVSYNRNLDGIEGRNNDRSIMLEGRWNLLNGGRDFRRRRETAYMVQEAAEIRNNTYRQVIESARLSWVAYQTNLMLIDDYEEHMVASRSTIDAYAKQFQLGQRTLLDLLNSENEYIGAKNVYTDAKYDILISQVRILYSIGILNDALNVDLSPLGAASHNLEDVMDYPEVFNNSGQYKSIDDPSTQKTIRNSENLTQKQIFNDNLLRKQQYEARLKHYGNRLYGADKKSEGIKDVSKKNKIKSKYSNKDTVIKRQNYANSRIMSRISSEQQKVVASSNAKSVENSYTIQLLATGNEQAVKKFINDAGLDGIANYYRAKKQNGKNWFLVTYGKYGSRKAADSAIKDLPEKMGTYKPWSRTNKSLDKAELVYGNVSDDPVA